MVRRPEILEDDVVPLPKSLDLDKHLNSMHTIERIHIEFIVSNDCVDAIIDKFGEDVETYAYDMNSFKAEVDVATNKFFIHG